MKFQTVMHRSGSNVKMAHAYLRAYDVMAITIAPLKMMRTTVNIMCRIMRLPNVQRMSSNVIPMELACPWSSFVMAQSIVWMAVTKLLAVKH